MTNKPGGKKGRRKMKAIILFFGKPYSSEEEEKLSFIQRICRIEQVNNHITGEGWSFSDSGLKCPVITAAPEIELIIRGHDDPNEVNYKKLSRLFWKLAKKQQKAKKEE